MTNIRIDIKRRWHAWLLLAVYVPMLVVSVLHLHVAISEGGNDNQGVVLVHATQHTAHSTTHQGDCPLCTFLHGGYLLPALIQAQAPICFEPASDDIFPYHFIFQSEAVQRHAPRAPPVSSLFC